MKITKNIDLMLRGDFFGSGGPQAKRHFKWLRERAKEGDSDAQYDLGRCYRRGEGVRQNYKEALNWYTKASEQGNFEAKTMLGVMYYTGEGVVQDYKKSLNWWRLSAEQGDLTAQYNLGIMYERGHGVSQDNVMAHMHWCIVSLVTCRSNPGSINLSKKKDADRKIKEVLVTTKQSEKAQDLAHEWIRNHQ